MKRCTKKEEKFCQKLIELGHQGKAYREAFDVGENTKDKTCQEAASRLMKKGKVIARMNELRELNVKSFLVTKEKLTNMYGVAYHLGIINGNPGAAVQATTGLGKLHGLIVERSEVKNSGSVAIKHEGVSQTLQWLEKLGEQPKSGSETQEPPSESLPN